MKDADRVSQDPAFEPVMFYRTFINGSRRPVHLRSPGHPFTLCGVRNVRACGPKAKPTCSQCLRIAAPVWKKWLNSPEYAALSSANYTGSGNA